MGNKRQTTNDFDASTARSGRPTVLLLALAAVLSLLSVPYGRPAAAQQNAATETLLDFPSYSLGGRDALKLDDDGDPVVALEEYADGYMDLYVVRCADNSCSAEPSIELVDDWAGIEVTGAALELNSNDVPVLYYQDAPFELRIAACNDAACAGGDEAFSSRILTTGILGGFDLDVDDYPIAPFFPAFDSDLSVVRCNDAACEGTDDTTTVVASGSVRDAQLLLDAGGNPLILASVESSADPSQYDLVMLSCSDPGCLAAPTRSTIDTNDYTGGAFRLDSAGLPVILYSSGLPGTPHLIRCDDVACTSHSTPVAVPGGRLQLDGVDRPIMAHTNEDAELYLTRCDDVACSSMTTNMVATGTYGTSFELRNGFIPVFARNYWLGGLDSGADLIGCVNARCAAPPAQLCSGLVVTVELDKGDVPTSGDDVILGTPGDDVIDALGGDDTVCAGGGNDIVSGGSGDDSLFGDGGNDIVFGGPGSDSVNGGAGNDVGQGGDGADVVDGGAGNDVLTGDGGADTIEGGPGIDWISGGDDDDILWVASSGTTSTDGGETVYGDAGDDAITGSAGNDVLLGGGDNDVIAGADGHDYLWGGPGNDLLIGGTGQNWLEGDTGDDHLDTVDAGSAEPNILLGGDDDDVLVGGQGSDYLWGGNGFDVSIANGGDDYLDGIAPDGMFDDLSGNDGNDTIIAGAGNDLLNGGNGSDYLFGNEGNDTIDGGAGDDYLDDTGTGNDTMNGGDGTDTVLGHGGDDTLDGGTGNADYVWGGPGTDTLAGGPGTDDTCDDDDGGAFGPSCENTIP